MKVEGFSILESLLAIVVMLLIITMTISTLEQEKFRIGAQLEESETIELLNIYCTLSAQPNSKKRLKLEQNKYSERIQIVRDRKNKILGFVFR